MTPTQTRILKDSDVDIDGTLQLNIGTAQPSAPQPAPTAAPQVRIAENTPGYALIEVTCSCGCSIPIKCDYQPTDSPNP
jgi:hypothetical protein